MLCVILGIWKKKTVQEWHTNLCEWKYEKTMLGTQTKSSQGIQVGTVEALHWKWCDPNLSFLWSWQEPAWVIMTFDGHRCPVPGSRKVVQTLKSQLPVPFLSLEGPSARALWCLSGLCRSLEWGHPGSWIPLIEYLCVLGPLFLWRMTGDPHLLTWLEQLLWGGVPGAGFCVAVHVLPQMSGWGPMGVGGSPSKAQLQNCKGKERTEERLSVEETFSHLYLYTHVYRHTHSSWQNQQFFLFYSF